MSRLVNDHGVNRFAFHPSATARNTILILSGYLLGTTVAHVSSPMLEGGALAAGLIGMLAYAVLAVVARKKRVQSARLAIQRATVHIERRMDQHVRIASARLMLRLHAAQSWSHEQYMPVVRSAVSVR
jgi:membrane protein DedA with SNARE-associated domain